MRSWARLGPAAAVLLLAPVGAAAAPRTHVVTIDKLKFGPMPAKVKVGDTIVWRNRDIFRHTTTSKAGGFDVDLPPGKVGKTVIRRAGALPFVCKFHPGMRGVLNASK